MAVTIGSLGRAASPLRPTGYVEIDGERHEAKLTPGLIASVDAGTAVVAVGVDRFGLLVRAGEEVPHPESLAGYGQALTPHGTPAGVDAEARWRQERWEFRVHLAFLLVLASIFPAIGGFAYGVEGVLIGFVFDLAVVPFWYFFGSVLGEVFF